MFLSERITQAEYSDSPDRSPTQIAQDFRQLGRVNALFKFSHPFEHLIPRSLGLERCRNLTILDLGAGDGSLGRQLTTWAAKRGWKWTVADLDLRPKALNLHNGGRRLVASVQHLPFRRGSFDVVIASQMTHHLDTPAEIIQHFHEAWRVSRELVVLSDLHRNLWLYCLAHVGTVLTGCSRELRADGLVSVRRGFRVTEWRQYAKSAGITTAKVFHYFGTRIILCARKGGRDLSAALI